MSSWVVPLLITLVVEVPIVALMFPGQRLRMGLTCLVATTVTNVLMNTVWAAHAGSYETYLLGGETGALVLEALAYAGMSRPRQWARALAASGAANAASFGAGLLLLPS